MQYPQKSRKKECEMSKLSRRDFVKVTMAAAGAAVVGGSFGPLVKNSFSAKEEIKIGYLKATHHAQLFVALEQGFYKDEGLEVKPVLFSGSGEIGSALVTGAIQAGYLGSSPSIGMITRDVPMNIVSGSAMESSAIVVPMNRPSDIKTVTDLRGKRIGTIRAATADIVVRYKMLEAGIDPVKDATVRNFTHIQDILTGLEKGDLDCAILWEPWASHAEATKYARPAFFSKDIWPKHVCCRLAYSTDWTAKNQDAAVKVMKAHIRGYMHIAKHFDDNVKANAKWCGIDENTIAVVFREKRQRLTLNLDPPGAKKFAEATKALGIIEKSEFQKNGLNETFQQLALKELGLKSLPDLGL
jgi:ABC-type nitrate/sulfonate/bicarbonate transport system substrate-binding protein